MAVSLGLAGLAPQAPAEQKLRPLHVDHGAKPTIQDSAGREVLLRGVNANGLGDYYRVNPQLRPTVPLGRPQFRRMSGFGFDVVRLVVSWSRLEPSRGEFNSRYVGRIRKRVRWASQRGMYVVIDMHEDAWGKYIATPPDEVCPEGSEPNQGWDGAPEWATITDGASTCRVGGRSQAPAVQRAYGAFWLDREGIQDELVKAWGRLARSFADDPAVAGYDLLNEPTPGDAGASGETTLLGTYYRNAIKAIRKGEAARLGGFHHIAFFEPSWWRPGPSDPHMPPPDFTPDRNVVYAPHLYSGLASGPLDGDWRGAVDDQMRVVSQTSRQYGAPVWGGEYGWFRTSQGRVVRRADAFDSRLAYFARRLDARRWGAAWWQWTTACGDPHAFENGQALVPARVVGNLHPIACPERRRLPVPRTTRLILERPYPRTAPGHLRLLRSHPVSARFRVKGVDPAPRTGSCRLLIWIPHRGKRRPVVGGSGSGLRLTRVAGGWRASVCVGHRYRVRGGYQ
jgi:endoglycosylceramidase